MNPWDVYKTRMDIIGPSRRESVLKRERRYLQTKLPDNLSYQSVMIDGAGQETAIIDTDNLNEKFIFSMPGEDIAHGGLVEWMDNYWLVTERDVANEVYTRAKIVQCNYFIKWVDKDGMIHEQWCIVEDGTKYLTGVYEDRDFITTRGDSRLAITLTKNIHTSKLRRGVRFLIDDQESDLKLAYELTKPYKLHNVYNGNGVFKFVCQEVNTTEDDNQELGVADYYKYYPKEPVDVVTSDTKIDPENNTTDDGRSVWL